MADKKPKRKMSAKQKANIAKLKKAGAVCRKTHEPFTKAFGSCMSDQFGGKKKK